jgi:hypothetical protein
MKEELEKLKAELEAKFGAEIEAIKEVLRSHLNPALFPPAKNTDDK